MEISAVSGRPSDSWSTTAAYPLMTPRCSSRRTRWCTAEVDNPVALPRSVYDMRPSAASSRTIARSRSSTARAPFVAHPHGPGTSSNLPSAGPLACGAIAESRPRTPAYEVNDRPITMRWTWLVPSTICSTLASRMYRSTGKSST